jgi:APA family basic amino acid/polyamine antiporter
MEKTKLRRILGLTECIFFGVGSILGAGVYALIGKVAATAGYMTWLSFGLASIAALCTAFSYAELSAAYPRSGGEYIFARYAFGRHFGTFLGLIISLSGIISGAAVAIGFGGYFSELFGPDILMASLGIISLVFLINIVGIRETSTINLLFTVIEAGGLMIVVYVAWSSLGSVDYFQLPSSGVNGVLSASALAFFAYIGFEEIVKLAEETRQPEWTIPRALFISNFIVLSIYALVAISVVSVVSPDELGKVANPLAIVVSDRFGEKGVWAISVIALFATSNTILSNMLGSSRVILNMAEEEKILRPLAPIWKKRQTPVRVLIIIFVMTCAFAFVDNLETVALMATFTIFTTFLIVNLSVIVLRKKQVDLQRPYRIPFNIAGIPVISVIGIILILVLLSYNVISLIS